MSERRTKIIVDVDEKPIKSLKAELRETINLMAAIPSESAKFQELGYKAAILKDKMAEVNEQVAVFATGSKYEMVSNSLGEIGAGLRDLDFDRVTQGAKLFQQNAARITFKDAIGSLKQMGSAFVSIGRTILTNPLFLIVAVVGTIVAAIVGLLDKLGILSKIFKVVGDAIEFVIQKLKDFLDWMGLTDFAAEESARKQAAAQEKIVAAHEKKKERVSDSYDHEIRMANIAGKSTVDLERQKQIAIIETSNAQVEALRANMMQLKLAGDLTKEKAGEIRKAIEELKHGIREAKQEIHAINATEVAEQKKKVQEVAKVVQSGNSQAKNKQKQYDADRLEAKRAIKDAELSLLQEGHEKELKENEEKYKRLIEDNERNERLVDTERKAIKKLLQEQEFEARELILDKIVVQELAAVRLIDDAKHEAQVLAMKAILENEAKIDEAKKDFAEKEKARQEAVKQNALDLSSSVLAGVQANLKQGSKAAKAVAVGQATIDTYKAATAAFASTAASPISIVFPAAPFLAAASAVALGIGNVRKILATDNSGGGGSTAPSATSYQAPSFGSAAQPQSTPQMNFNNGQNQSAGGQAMKQKVMVVDYHDIKDKGNELYQLQNKVSLV